MTAISRKSAVSGKVNTLELAVTEKEILEWKKSGQMIQDFFPDLTPGEREFLLSGATEEEWDALFGEEE